MEGKRAQALNVALFAWVWGVWGLVFEEDMLSTPSWRLIYTVGSHVLLCIYSSNSQALLLTVPAVTSAIDSGNEASKGPRFRTGQRNNRAFMSLPAPHFFC